MKNEKENDKFLKPLKERPNQNAREEFKIELKDKLLIHTQQKNGKRLHRHLLPVALTFSLFIIGILVGMGFLAQNEKYNASDETKIINDFKGENSQQNNEKNDVDIKNPNLSLLPKFKGTISKITSNDSSRIRVTNKEWEEAKFHSDFSPIKDFKKEDFSFWETVKGTINETPFQIDIYSESKSGYFNLISKFGDNINISFPELPTMTPFVFYGENVYLVHKAKGISRSYNIVKQKFFEDKNVNVLGRFLSETVKRDNEIQNLKVGTKIKIANNNAILYQKDDIVYVVDNYIRRKEYTFKPSDVIGIRNIENNATPYLPNGDVQYNMTTRASYEWGYLIVGNLKDDETTGIIVHVTKTESGGLNFQEYKYPGLGTITFNKILIEKDAGYHNIITLTYKNGKKGYFNIKENKLVENQY